MFYLHKMGYMHRDIKPSNVLLSGDPKTGIFIAKLTDFGLAVKVQNASVNGKELTAETVRITAFILFCSLDSS